MLKADGSVLVHADAGGYKPLNWMTPPTVIEDDGDALVVRKRAGKTEDRLEIRLLEVLSDASHEMGEAAALEKDGVERDLQELLAERPDVLGEELRLVRREWPTDIGPVDLMCRDADDGWVAVEIKRVGTIDAVEQLCRYLERIRLDPALADARGVLAAQRFKPQALVLADGRGIRCVEVDLARAARRARARADALRVTRARLRESESKARGNPPPRRLSQEDSPCIEGQLRCSCRAPRSCSRPQPPEPQARRHRRLRLHAHQLARRKRRRGVRPRRRRHARARGHRSRPAASAPEPNLGSQGAIILGEGGHELFAVNAGSNSISYFKRAATTGSSCRTRSPRAASSRSASPLHDHVLYVLNAGGAGNITGFTVRHDELAPLAGSTQPLGAGSSGPAQVSFSPNGKTLVVTEKASSTIDTYVVGEHGIAGAPIVNAAAGNTPFGFDFDKRGDVLDVRRRRLRVVLRRREERLAVRDQRRRADAPGRAVLARRRARTAATRTPRTPAGGTISGFAVGHDGSLSLLDPSGVSGNLGAG